jgi:hypothetical protein
MLRRLRRTGREDFVLRTQLSGRAIENLSEQRRRRILTVCLVGLALAPLLAGGCETSNGASRVLELSALRLNSFVLQSEQPVLVNFYKPG